MPGSDGTQTPTVRGGAGDSGVRGLGVEETDHWSPQDTWSVLPSYWLQLRSQNFYICGNCWPVTGSSVADTDSQQTALSYGKTILNSKYLFDSFSNI